MSLQAEFTESGSLLLTKDEIASSKELLRNDIYMPLSNYPQDILTIEEK